MRTLCFVSVLALLSACQVGSFTRTSISLIYDAEGRLCDILEVCEDGYFIRAEDGTKVNAEVDWGLGSVTVSVEGKGTKTCTPKTEGALEDLKKELDKCRCPEPQDNAGGKGDGGDADGDVEEADRETLEPACEGETRVEELAAVEEFCEVELKSSDWDCVDVPAPIPQRP